MANDRRSHEQPTNAARKQRNIEEEFTADQRTDFSQQEDIESEIRTQVQTLLEISCSSTEEDRALAKRCILILSDFAKNVPPVHRMLSADTQKLGSNLLQEGKHLISEDGCPEHQQHIVDAGALPHLVALLKRHKDGQFSRAVNGAIIKAADAITSLAHENGSIKTLVRIDGGIPPLVELLESSDAKVQRAAAGALRTLAFENDENKTQIVDCNALPTLVLMLQSEDVAIQFEAVGVIGNLVHSSPSIKKQVALAGALQPVIELLSSTCSEIQREAALLLGQFSAADTDCKVHIVQRGAVGPPIELLQSPEAQLKEMSPFALGRLAQYQGEEAPAASANPPARMSLADAAMLSILQSFLAEETKHRHN